MLYAWWGQSSLESQSSLYVRLTMLCSVYGGSVQWVGRLPGWTVTCGAGVTGIEKLPLFQTNLFTIFNQICQNQNQNGMVLFIKANSTFESQIFLWA